MAQAQPQPSAVIEARVTKPRREPLHLIVGPMFSGKTTELVRLIRTMKHAERVTLVVKPSKDTRYSSEHIVTHFHDKEEALSVEKLNDVPAVRLERADCVFVDEAQFFPDLAKTIRSWLRLFPRLELFVAGLSADSERRPFGQIHELLCVASTTTHLSGVCFFCKELGATCSARIVKTAEIEVVGGKETYVCACNICHDERNVYVQPANIKASNKNSTSEAKKQVPDGFPEVGYNTVSTRSRGYSFHSQI